MKRVLGFSLAFLLAGLSSCGSSLVENQTFNCCLGQQFYNCPEINTFTACYNYQDASGCNRMPVYDPQCPAQNSFTCCVGKQFYTCPDLTTLTACFGQQDGTACRREAAKDTACPL